jgi:hypothetical protein
MRFHSRIHAPLPLLIPVPGFVLRPSDAHSLRVQRVQNIHAAQIFAHTYTYFGMSGSTACDFSPSLCGAHDASRWLATAAGVFVCVTTNQKAAKHTHAKNKLQKLALGGAEAAEASTLCCCGRMKNDARRGIKVSEMGSPTV